MPLSQGHQGPVGRRRCEQKCPETGGISAHRLAQRGNVGLVASARTRLRDRIL